MWGSCCFNTGDIKITLGTGSFLNLNTGTHCPASIYGLYPLVAWKCSNKKNNESELVYCMEGASNDTGSIIQWAISFGKIPDCLFIILMFQMKIQSFFLFAGFVCKGLFDDPAKSAEIAYSIDDNEEVYFVPAFSGLGVSFIYM